MFVTTLSYQLGNAQNIERQLCQVLKKGIDAISLHNYHYKKCLLHLTHKQTGSSQSQKKSVRKWQRWHQSISLLGSKVVFPIYCPTGRGEDVNFDICLMGASLSKKKRNHESWYGLGHTQILNFFTAPMASGRYPKVAANKSHSTCLKSVGEEGSDCWQGNLFLK